MRYLKIVVTGALLLAVSAVFVPASSVFAKENDEVATRPLNAEISPARLTLQGKPGETINTEIKIRNRNAGATKFKIEIMKVRSDGKTLSLETPAANDDFIKWVSFGSKKTFTVKYDEWKTIPVTLEVPEDAAFTYDYAIVISNAELPPSAPGSTQSIDGKIALFTLLDVDAPGAVRAAAIQRFEASSPWVTYLPVGFETEMKNIGNLHVAPVGNLFIKDMFGRQVATMTVNKEAGYILTDHSKTVTNEWTNGFPYNRIKADGTTELVWDWSQLSSIRIGKYTADVVLIYNDGQRDIPITSQTSFWVIPWPILLVLLVIIVIVVAGIVSFFRSIGRLIRRMGGGSKKIVEEKEVVVQEVHVENDDEEVAALAEEVVGTPVSKPKKKTTKQLKVPGHANKKKKSSSIPKSTDDSK